MSATGTSLAARAMAMMAASGEAGGGSATAAPSPLSPADLQAAAQRAKLVAAAFGEIVGLMMRVEPYRALTLADLEWSLMPAIATGQYAVMERQAAESGQVAPVCVLLWASVSEEVASRLAASTASPLRLAPSDWKSGSIIWLVDVIGGAKVAGPLLRQFAASHWQGRDVRLRRREADGRLTVVKLG